VTADFRFVAHAAKGQWAEAHAALDTVTAINAATPEGADGKTALSIAVPALSGEIATRRGDLDAGINHFREAATIEDAGLYFEPPKWYYPIRHSLGAALLKAGQHAEAEKVYREDLRRFPENGWSLLGLAQALRAQAARGGSAAHAACFAIHAVLAGAALLTGHPRGALWILLPGVVMHLYPVLLQRSILLRLQPLLYRADSLPGTGACAREQRKSSPR